MRGRSINGFKACLVGSFLLGQGALAAENSAKAPSLPSALPHTESEASPEALALHLEAIRLYEEEEDSAAAIPILERACSEYAFSTCAINLASAYHSLSDCRGVPYYQDYLRQEMTGNARFEAQNSCVELAGFCKLDAEEYCLPATTKTPEPAVEAPESASIPAVPPPLLPIVRPLPTPIAPRSLAPYLYRPTSETAEQYQIIGSTLISLGVVAGMMAAGSGVDLYLATKEWRDLRRRVDADSSLGKTANKRYDDLSGLQLKTIGFGVASGILLTTGAALWISEGSVLRWTFSAGLEPQVGLKGRF